MKRNINKGLRILFSLSFLLSTSIVLGQCPLNIGESTSAPMDNLLLHLPLDNNLDNLGSGSYTMDLSGATYVETQCAQGLSFDGVNDYLSISPTLNLVDDFTISAWISTESQGEWMGIFSIREQCPTTYRGYSIVEFGLGNYDVPTLSNQVNQHLNCTGYSGGDRYTDPSIVIPNSIETFVAVVVENNSSDDRIVKLYVNCIEYDAIMTYDLPSAVCFNNAITYSTTIGATSNVSGLSNTFDGTIDDIRVYDTALSPLQLLDIYQSCLPVAIDVASAQDCSADSALITLYNSQLGVDYQLMDITNNVPIGFPQAGNCAPLLFSTEIVYDTTEFQIIAINSTSNCSIEMDSIITIFPTNGYFYDSNSIVLCSGDSVLIGNQYVSAAGIYNDTILNPSNCDSIISYSVNFIAAINVDLGNDTTLCDGALFTLDAIAPNATYLWSNNSTNPFLTVSEQGTYWIQVTANNCSSTDTINVNYNIIPSVDLGNDTSICEGEVILLDASTSNATYLWHDNSTDPSISVSQQGTYWAEVTVENCTNMDSINVNVISKPNIDFGNDTTICHGKTLTIDVSTTNATYLWQDNSSNSILNINQTGTYWNITSNICGSDSDSISVKFEKCECNLYIPNAFSPNGDQINETFYPVSNCIFSYYKLLIFNRWGQLVFESNEPSIQWNGDYKGRKSEIEVYTYILKYAYSFNDIIEQLTGQITLLR